MGEDWNVPAVVVIATAVLVVLGLVALGAALRRVRRVLRSTRAHSAAVEAALVARIDTLAGQVADVERRLASHARRPVDDSPEYVITRLGDEEPENAPVPAVEAPVFADLVLRESAVQAASLAAGLRRALSPEVRFRIRHEMRREVKRARKQRRAEVRRARREQGSAGPVDVATFDEDAA